MAARQILMAVIESSYGTAKTSPTLGTDSFYLRLDQDNAFTMEADPVQQPISYGGGLEIEGDVVADLVECKGAFSFTLWPGVWSSVLLNWALTTINSGRTAPWTTTDANNVMPVGDLASLSFYHAYLTEDGSTYKRTRYAGCKAENITLAASETGQGRIWKLSGNVTGIKPVGNPWDSSTDPTSTEFPLPAETNYPTGPYTFGHLGSGTGTVTVGTNRAASCMSLSLSVKNTLTPNYYASRFLSTHRFVGRQTTADLTLLYKSTPDDRGSYRSLSPLATSFKIDNGVNSIALSFNGKNVIRPWKRALPNAQQYQQQLTIANRWDPSAATDITLTTA